MREYFQVAIPQQIQRVQNLLNVIHDSSIPPQYRALATNCRNMLTTAMGEFKQLQENPDLQHPDLQAARLRQFRRIVDDVSNLEVTGLAALSRRHKDDIFLTQLIDLICKEIKYPHLPPTVTALSTSYFYILNPLELMFVPLNEGNYLLHLPDIYHELAHPLLFDENNIRVEPFRRFATLAWAYALEYVQSEIEHEKRRRGAQMDMYLFYLTLWQRSWRSWIVEFFCDLFAIFTLGTAYAWSHLHLCMKMGNDPFDVPTRSLSSHPADAARMRVMLLGLNKIGFTQNIPELRTRWDEYLNIANVKVSSNYNRCYPKHLLEKIVDLAYVGLSQTPCRIADATTNDTIHTTLNEAWLQFWSHAHAYIAWEKDQVTNLKTMCKVNDEIVK